MMMMTVMVMTMMMLMLILRYTAMGSGSRLSGLTDVEWAHLELGKYICINYEYYYCDGLGCCFRLVCIYACTVVCF